jgi:hypothetical protein
MVPAKKKSRTPKYTRRIVADHLKKRDDGNLSSKIALLRGVSALAGFPWSRNLRAIDFRLPFPASLCYLFKTYQYGFWLVKLLKILPYLLPSCNQKFTPIAEITFDV